MSKVTDMDSLMRTLPHVKGDRHRQWGEDWGVGGATGFLLVPPKWPRLHPAGARVVCLQRSTRQVYNVTTVGNVTRKMSQWSEMSQE